MLWGPIIKKMLMARLKSTPIGGAIAGARGGGLAAGLGRGGGQAEGQRPGAAQLPELDAMGAGLDMEEPMEERIRRMLQERMGGGFTPPRAEW